jgi:hypothetical protein
MLDNFNLEPTNAQAVHAGQRFGRLVVLATGQKPNTYKYYAICVCDCGTPAKKIRFDGLVNGVVVSCGCYRLEQVTTDGFSSSPHYNRWKNMLSRCNNPADAVYKNYGGRGIRVCDDWHMFSNFLKGLPEGYFEGAEIDRIDNDGHYEPNNVRWITRQGNTDNRRTGVNLTFNGKTQSLARWGEETGFGIKLLSSRLREHGWTVEKLLTTPPLDAHARMKEAHKKRWEGHVKKPELPKMVYRTVNFYGSEVTLKQLEALTGISRRLLAKRIFERGWTVERATATK